MKYLTLAGIGSLGIASRAGNAYPTHFVIQFIFLNHELSFWNESKFRAGEGEGRFAFWMPGGLNLWSLSEEIFSLNHG